MTTALMLIDLQRIFAEPQSPWAAPDFDSAADSCRRLLAGWHGPVAVTRFVLPEQIMGAWQPYYRDWPFATDPANSALYDLVDGVDTTGAVAIDRPKFGKWDAATAAALPGVTELVVGGVSTDCCVLATALAAADDGIQVTIATDACAGATAADHQRALEAMALFAPMIRQSTVQEILER